MGTKAGRLLCSQCQVSIWGEISKLQGGGGMVAVAIASSSPVGSHVNLASLVK